MNPAQDLTAGGGQPGPLAIVAGPQQAGRFHREVREQVGGGPEAILRGPQETRRRLRPNSLDDMCSRKIQVTIEALEETVAGMSGLDFPMLRKYDAHGSLEASRQTRWLNSAADIQV